MAKTVKVPPQFEALFAKAEEQVAGFFREKKEDPSTGTIEIFGERYILVRAASMSVEFFDTVRDLYRDQGEEQANNMARQLLFDVAHAIGRQDARNFHRKMGLHDPVEKLSAGPVHFAHTGWAFVDIFPESRPSPDENYYLIYDHPYSFESSSWMKEGRHSDFPVCVMNAGYSSGWCEESFGVTLVASEILCRAKGDEACRFIMAHPSRIEEKIQDYVKARPAPISSYEIPGFFRRKQMEEALERKLAQRTQELERAQEDLMRKERLATLGQLAGAVGNELRNPLGVMNNALFYLSTVLTEADDTTREYLGIIGDGIETAAHIISNLQDAMRAEPANPKAVAPLSLVAGSLKRCAVPENVSLQVAVDEDLPPVNVDPPQMHRVLINLIHNALEAMPNGGELGISADVIEGHVHLRVRDTGAGLTPENMADLFKPLFTTKVRGLGLGLTVVKNLTENNGGRVEVESSPGQGATFTVVLPLRQEVPRE